MRRLLLLLAVMIPLAAPSSAAAAGLPADWDKGINFTAWWHDSYGTAAAETSMNRIDDLGTNSTAIVTSWYMESSTGTSIAPDASRTPSDASITTAVRRAKARGMRVFLRPMVEAKGTYSWRGSHQPSDVAAWFSSYRAMMTHYAKLSESLGIEMLDAGSEYRSLERYESEWRSVIATIRANYNGKVTYSTNIADHKTTPFWDAVDIIGIDAYFELGRGGAVPSSDEIAARWENYTTLDGKAHRYIADLEATHARYGKPVFFAEIGYPSIVDPLTQPWISTGVYSGPEQGRALEGAFKAFIGKPWFKGMYVWQWYWDHTKGGPGNTDQMIQNKPSEAVVKDWFSGAAVEQPAPAATPEPTPTPTPEVTPEPPATDTTTTVRVKVRGRKKRAAVSSAARVRRVLAAGRVAGAEGGHVRLALSVRSARTGRWHRVRSVRARVGAYGRFQADVARARRGLLRLDARFLGTDGATASKARETFRAYARRR